MEEFEDFNSDEWYFNDPQSDEESNEYFYNAEEEADLDALFDDVFGEIFSNSNAPKRESIEYASAISDLKVHNYLNDVAHIEFIPVIDKSRDVIEVEAVGGLLDGAVIKINDFDFPFHIIDIGYEAKIHHYLVLKGSSKAHYAESSSHESNK